MLAKDILDLYVSFIDGILYVLEVDPAPRKCVAKVSTRVTEKIHLSCLACIFRAHVEQIRNGYQG